VNKDGSGNLSGYGWSTSAGWINFDPTDGGVTINPATGSFDGYAWGENIGWVHFKRTNVPAYNVAYTLPPQTGPTFVVNTNADTNDGFCDNLGQGHGNKDCTLREAINAANSNSGLDVIHFANDYTISLTSTLPTITDAVTIDGETHKVTLDGNLGFRILTYSTDGGGYLDHLTLLNGSANPALAFGNSGGALYSESSSGIDIRNSAFHNNSAGDYGGAIFSDGTILISNSTLSNNSSGLGGGAAADNLTVRNSTLSGNSAPTGAALYAGGSLTLKNSILANSTGPDCASGGTIASALNNLIESTGGDACGLTNGVNGNKIGMDPNLGALGNNGGVTETFALLAVSQAIDAGDNTTCAADPINNLDQRGSARPFGAHCDMGAFEKTTSDCTSSEKPAKPISLKPTQNQSINKTKVKFDWGDAVCATSYKITVKNLTTGAKVTKTVTSSKATLTLAHGNQKWSVQACNGNGCTKSAKWKFSN
jgi:CSLREA domain-containing protein